MVTPRGRSVLVLAAVLLAAGRVLALRELLMVGTAMLVLCGISAAAVLARRWELEVQRTASPPRAPAGVQRRVELTVTNRSLRPTRPLLVEDRLPPELGEPVRLSVPPLGAGGERTVSYLLRPPVRGRFQLGPAQVVWTDPFALFTKRQTLAGTTTVVAYPAFERLRTLPRRTRQAGGLRRSPILGQGDEFYALRPYAEGDDLRKIHWPSSLRVGEVVVRQEERWTQPGVMIVLDTCAARHRPPGRHSSLEPAVSAAAAVAVLALGAGLPLEIITPDGPLLASTRPSEDEVLEALAVVAPSPRPDLCAALARTAARGPSAATLVVISPGLGGRELALLRSAVPKPAAGAMVVVGTPAPRRGPAPPRARTATPSPPRRQAAQDAAARLAAFGLPVGRLGDGDSFRDLWERMVRGVAVAR